MIDLHVLLKDPYILWKSHFAGGKENGDHQIIGKVGLHRPVLYCGKHGVTNDYRNINLILDQDVVHHPDHVVVHDIVVHSGQEVACKSEIEQPCRHVALN